MPLPLHLPRAAGLAALAEVDEVPWRLLRFAYTGDAPLRHGLYHDVPGSLRALGAADPGPALGALFANVYHQRTVYEATAYAVPFLAAVASDPAFATGTARLELFTLLLAIALSSTWETEDGTQAGALGDGTATLIRSALRTSLPAIRAAAALDPALPPVIAPLEALLAPEELEEITEAQHAAVREVLAANEAEARARRARADEAAAPPRPAPQGRYRHPRFGEATLLEVLEGDRLRLRFDDGVDRVILARYLTAIETTR
jgi:hypothetical protein